MEQQHAMSGRWITVARQTRSSVRKINQ